MKLNIDKVIFNLESHGECSVTNSVFPCVATGTNNDCPSICASVIVCGVPLGVLFWVQTTQGLFGLASPIHLYRLVSSMQCSSNFVV
jgi:hypothetical protein